MRAPVQSVEISVQAEGKLALVFAVFFLASAPAPTLAFNPAGCGAGECKDCHKLDQAEAAGFVAGMANTVEGVGFANIPGLFEVQTVTKGTRFPLYIDFSKSWVLQANVAAVRGQVAKSAPMAAPTGTNPGPSAAVARTGKGSCGQVSVPKVANKPMTVDLTKLKPEGSLLLGKKGSKKTIVVFTDPQCPWCKKLHEEMKKAVETDSTVAFSIRMLPLAIHQGAYDLCKSVVCAGTMAALEDAFAGKKLPPTSCDGKSLEETIAFVRANGISSTPTLVMPDGKIVPGFRKAEELLELLSKK